MVNEGICWEDMPRTFQDAIIITRGLGFEYVWIDCLCIIQDSEEDWNKEAPRMAGVYGNSACNIAALGEDSHAGCFVRRNSLSYSPCRVLSNGHGDVHFQLDDYTTNGPIRKCPLFTRAWVLQERVLAPRNVYYGESQIHWECSQGSACETKSIPTRCKVRAKWVSHPDHWQKDALKVLQQSRGGSERVNGYEIQVAWQKLVEVYCTLKLTVATDKFIALSAIMKVFEERFGVSYVNGLWREHLPSGLLWYVNYEFPKHLVTEIPSWSWAAINPDSNHSNLYFSALGVRGREHSLYHGGRSFGLRDSREDHENPY
jgi:hypothetical protein